MELLKQETPLEFKYHDVVFYVKPRATSNDKLKLALSQAGKLSGNSTSYDMITFYEILVEQFIVGWSGVTEEGRAVPYSFHLFKSRFPSVQTDNVFMELGTFIIDKTDIFKKDIELKKDLRKHSNGSSTPEPLIASASTA